MRALLVALVASFALAGCLEPDVSRCAGLVCSPGLVCHTSLATCVLPEQITACESKTENADCSYAGTPAGNCLQGVCAPRGCGNGIMEIGEVCDDSNVMSGDGCASDCKSNETCGNMVTDLAVGEACDDGNDVSGDGCQANCTLPTCGDGALDTGEICDDGNTANGDGCNAKCTSNETCNNGVVDVAANEDCDDGNGSAGDGCFDCIFEVCGNSRVDSGEMCDDGNTDSNDGCAFNCRSNEECGNGVIDIHKGEACDAGGANANTPNADCRADCRPRRCGDGVVDDLVGEQCEAGQLGAATCASAFGYYGGTLSCSSTCGYSPDTCVGTCGDGIVQADEGEECDTSAFADPSVTCVDYGYYAAAGLACSPGCTVTAGLCQGGRCGDGALDAVELCDPGNASLPADLGGSDCTDLGYYEETGLACSLGCSFNTSSCTGGRCGDHVRNGPEFCDGTVPTGSTCADFGFDMGRVGCTGFCAPGYSSDCSARSFHADPTPTGVSLRDVWQATATTMFAVGDGGTILYHDGLGWQTMVSNTTADLRSVWGSSPTDVYAVGGGTAATVLHYNGIAWSPVGIGSVSPVTMLSGVDGTGPSDVWIVGGNSPNATIAHWNGATWTVQTSLGFGVSFADVYAPMPGTVIAVGAGGTIRRYSGGTWSAITPSQSSTFMHIWGRSANEFYVSGANSGTASASIQRCDASSACTLERQFGSRLIPAVFGNATELYAVVSDSGSAGVSEIVRKGPALWTTVHSTTSGRFWGGALSAAGDTLAVGELGTIVRAPVWTATLFTGLTSGTWNDVWAVGETEAFIVGTGGNIRRRDFTNLSTTWTAMTSNTAQTLNSVWGTSPSRVFAVGASGTIRLWDGVGPGWITMTTNPATTNHFNAVWGSSDTDVYAVGDGGAIYHYDGNASNEWTAVSAGIGGNDLNGVGGSGPGDVYVVGFAGIMGRYNGATWSSIGLGQGFTTFNDVVARGPGDVFVVGINGQVVRSTDNGVTWRRMAAPTTTTLTAIDARGPRGDVWIAGLAGELLHFDDERWTNVRAVNTDPLNGVSIGGNHVYFVSTITSGRSGFELHHNVGVSEHCGNEWDDDVDGFSDCADSDCAGSDYCTDGGACEIAGTITCGATLSGDSFTGSPFPDDYACSPRKETGPETGYRFTALATGSVTATLSGYTGDLDLIVIEEYASGGCDIGACVAAASTTSAPEQLTFSAVSGQTYQIIVDGFAGAASSFQLALSCP